MGSILSYAEENLDTFSQRPFNRVDSLILSWVSYMSIPQAATEAHTWAGLPLKELFRAEYFPHLFHGIWGKAKSKQLFTAMAASPRFRDIRVMGQKEQTDLGMEKQFAAVSFQLQPNLCYVAFRGTDASLVGWKEDFNMAFLSPVPSQEEAARYLAAAGAHCAGELLVGGHSKGGNLSVYAAAHVPPALQARIRKVYSHDGPGFLSATLAQPGFRAISAKVEKTVPQSSIVGLLLDQHPDPLVVQSTRASFLQHDPFSWVVEGTDFLYDQLTADAKYWDRTLDDWLQQRSPQELERFVEALYDILTAVNLSDFSTLQSDWQKTLPAVMRAAAHLDPDTRRFLLETISNLFAVSLRNFPERFRESKETPAPKNEA